MRNSKIDKRNIEIATMTNCNVAWRVGAGAGGS